MYRSFDADESNASFHYFLITVYTIYSQEKTMLLNTGIEGRTAGGPKR
jgi:hypothetical protein